MLIWVSLIQIIIVCLNNYNFLPYIGSYKEDFPIITDIGLKNTINKTKQVKEDY